MKSLDEIKESMAIRSFYDVFKFTPDLAEEVVPEIEFFKIGFTACQSLTIDRRDVNLLLEALEKSLELNNTPEIHQGDRWYQEQKRCDDAFEAFYKKYPEMKEGE